MTHDTSRQSYPTDLLHYELREGRVLPVPQHLQHPQAGAAAEAIQAASNRRSMVALPGSNFSVFADLRKITEGYAGFMVGTRQPLGGGLVRSGTIVYTAVVSCRLANSPLAWRQVLRAYFGALAAAPEHLTFCAPGLMPRTQFLAGFWAAECAPATAVERAQMLTITHVTARAVYNKCECAARRAEAAGHRFCPDANIYPELLDWED